MFRKRYGMITVVLFMISIGIFNGCSSKDPDRYYCKKDDFSLKLPKEWETKEGFMGSSVISLSPLENSADQFRENVNVVVEKMPGEMPLDEYFTGNIANMKKFFTEFQEDEKGNTSIDETDAKWLVYSGKMGTLSVKNKVYFIIHDKRGYTITCSATPDGFARYKKTFDAIAYSFEFE
jgi:hypothetical protein